MWLVMPEGSTPYAGDNYRAFIIEVASTSVTVAAEDDESQIVTFVIPEQDEMLVEQQRLDQNAVE